MRDRHDFEPPVAPAFDVVIIFFRASLSFNGSTPATDKAKARNSHFSFPDPAGLLMTGLFANGPYVRLFSAASLANLADGMSQLALPWLATLLTRDPLLISAVMFAHRAPWLLFAIPMGVLTDRMDRGRIMVGSDTARVLVTLVLVTMILVMPDGQQSETLPFYLGGLYTISLFLGAAAVFRDNAAQTILPQIVPPDELERANGQIWSVEQIARSLIGPLLAGAVIALSIGWPFTLNILAFALAALLMRGVSAPPRPARVTATFLADAAEGWRWMRAHSTILRLAVMLSLMNAMSAMVLTMLVLFSQEILNLTAFGHGILLTFGAIGGIAGGLIGPNLVKRVGRQRSVIASLLVYPACFLIIGVSSSVFLAGLAFTLNMFGSVMWNLVTVSYRQRLIPAELLGRVNSIYRFFGWGTIPIGAIASGALVVAVEPAFSRTLAIRTPFCVAAAGSMLVFLYGLAKLRLSVPSQERSQNEAAASSAWTNKESEALKHPQRSRYCASGSKATLRP
jgi:MFS family permease